MDLVLLSASFSDWPSSCSAGWSGGFGVGAGPSLGEFFRLAYPPGTFGQQLLHRLVNAGLVLELVFLSASFSDWLSSCSTGWSRRVRCWSWSFSWQVFQIDSAVAPPVGQRRFGVGAGLSLCEFFRLAQQLLHRLVKAGSVLELVFLLASFSDWPRGRLTGWSERVWCWSWSFS